MLAINTLLMKNQYRQLYNEMMADISWCLQSNLPDEEKVESCYRMAGKYWSVLKEIIKHQDFETDEAEIEFFKHVKPLFTSQIEYYTLVYQSVLFRPENNAQKLQAFWEEELKRLQRFRDSRHDFVSYFKTGSTSLDDQYFLRRNNDPNNALFCKMYDQDVEYTTLQDFLVATLLAQEMYHTYVKEKLEELKRIIASAQ